MTSHAHCAPPCHSQACGQADLKFGRLSHRRSSLLVAFARNRRRGSVTKERPPTVEDPTELQRFPFFDKITLPEEAPAEVKEPHQGVPLQQTTPVHIHPTQITRDRQQDQELHSQNAKAKAMTAYIKASWQAAADQAKSTASSQAVLAFFSKMDKLCTESFSYLNFVHLNAILHGTVLIWTAWGSGPGGKQQQQASTPELKQFLTRTLDKLQKLMPTVGAREASNMLYSFSEIGINPDTLQPGITDGLARQFLQHIDNASDRSYTHAIMACLRLQLDPCEGKMIPETLQKLSKLNMLDPKGSPFNAQSCANIIQSLSKMPSVKPPTKLLKAMCNVVLRKLQHVQEAKLPTGFVVATFAWGLAQLKYSPSPKLSSGLLNRMLQLCRAPATKMDPQTISNFLMACAELRVAMNQDEADTLLSHMLLNSRLPRQALSNAAWALASLELLQIDSYRRILQAVQTASGQGTSAEHNQLYQALDSIEPQATNLQQHQDWTRLQADLVSLGPRSTPFPRKPTIRGSKELSAVLTALAIPHESPALVDGYCLNAVVQPKNVTAKPLLFHCRASETFDNDKDRLTGHALFRRKQLSKRGVLITFPLTTAEGDSDMLTEYLKQAVEVAVGTDLDGYTR